MHGAAAFALQIALAAALGCSSEEPAAPPAPSVRVERVTPRAVVASEEYVARISASNTVEIRPQIDGRLEQQAAVEGQPVEAGALLFQIDPAPFRAELARAEAEGALAEARLAQARRELARVRQLARSNIASEQMLDAAETQEKAADAARRAAIADVETARLQLAYTRVTSPIAGVVGRAEVRIGASVEAYQSLLTRVYANDPMYVDFSIGEQRMLQMQRRYGPDLAQGSGEFRIRLADDSAYPLPGRLDFVDTALDAQTATLPMRLVVPNPDGLLRANQFARVVVPVDTAEDALVVSFQAVQALQGTHSVWVVDDAGRVESRSVELGARLDDGWVVRRGLEAGERVVVDGVQKLRPGLVVQAQPLSANVAAQGNAGAPDEVAAKEPAEAAGDVAAKASADAPAEARNGS